MRFLRALTRLQTAAALTLFGIALALAPLGLDAVGYELSRQQGYGVLGLAVLFVVGAVIVLVWPLATEAWAWLRRDSELRDLQEAQERLAGSLHKAERELDAFR
ncbi:MAG: hypothetical protein AVDCRST_MAG22-127 [uncultured Rubrobacteraceae bacterium]|uniref:Uncharacterized protein n=1 Tax=uncultured Rubrobacteraceae bacterium TaxID=349277 RepID=A0A6J4NBT8_9ACTN|nr:MAG: hypothetical protein AVDCRST_MAG22-127 [uncultured Rubrobacteraceae bacterium]